MTPRGRVRCVARWRAPGRPQARQLRARLRQTSVGGAACGRMFSARLGRCRGARPRVSRCGNVRRLGRRQAALQRGRAVVRPASERGLRGSPSSPTLRGAAVPGAGLSDRRTVVRKAVHKRFTKGETEAPAARLTRDHAVSGGTRFSRFSPRKVWRFGRWDSLPPPADHRVTLGAGARPFRPPSQREPTPRPQDTNPACRPQWVPDSAPHSGRSLALGARALPWDPRVRVWGHGSSQVGRRSHVLTWKQTGCLPIV